MIKIDTDFTNPLIEKLKFLPRGRTNYNFHSDNNDTLQRMLNVMSKNSYIQPHKHENPDKREVFIILQGTVAVIEFDNSGKIIDKIILNSEQGHFAAEIPSNTWHTIICIEETAVVYELKDGPYDASTDKEFALWAPKEEDTESLTYLNKISEQIG